MRLTAVFLASGATIAAAVSGCGSGIQALLAPLDAYPPASSYCSAHYPATVTVTGLKRRAASTTTSSKSSATTTTSSKASTTPATSTKASTTTADPRAALFSTLVAEVEGVVSTFCACNFPPVTVTSHSTTTTTTTTTTPPVTTTTTTTPPPITTTTTTTTTTSSTTTSSTCTPVPTNDPRCQQESGACCSNVSDGCTPCTNTAVVCVKACDTNSQCIYGGLSQQYDTVVAYNAGNLCAAYSGCTGCPASKLLMRDEAATQSRRKRSVIEEFADRKVRKLI